jgi:NADPH:quinone reductase
MPIPNRQIRLAARPVGLPRESDFTLHHSIASSPAEGEVLVRSIFLSVDPYMRGRISGVASYAAPVNIGDVIVGGAVGKVVESADPAFSIGDIVEGRLGWQEYALMRGKELRKIDPSLAPISTAVGVLGMPGLTAYFGLLEICHPNAGETVVVSGAAGAVGAIVGQIAQIQGCHVVGIAGDDRKIAYLTQELGFDSAFNYRKVQDYLAKLKELCPNGIDVYFDNVGGAISDAVMRLINVKARIAICGQISQYNLEEPEMGPRLLNILVSRQARMEGFLVFQFADRYREGLTQMAEWIKQGKLKYREDIEHGMENAPRAFIRMLKGENFGKQLVKVSDP